MINAKTAKALRQGIRSAFQLASIPAGRLHYGEGQSDYKQTRAWGRVDGKFLPYLVKTTGTLDRMIPRALYLRAKKGLALERRTINRARA